MSAEALKLKFVCALKDFFVQETTFKLVLCFNTPRTGFKKRITLLGPDLKPRSLIIGPKVLPHNAPGLSKNFRIMKGKHPSGCVLVRALSDFSLYSDLLLARIVIFSWKKIQYSHMFCDMCVCQCLLGVIAAPDVQRVRDVHVKIATKTCIACAFLSENPPFVTCVHDMCFDRS